MSEDFADRTEAPTPRRREQFRREGKVAVSRDLNGAAVVITVLLLLSASGPHVARTLEDVLRDSLSLSSQSMQPAALLWNVERTALVALLPLLLSVLAIAVLVNVVQIGLPLSFHLPSRGEGSRRPRFSVTNLLGGLVKITVLGFVAWKVLWSNLGVLLASTSAEFPHFAAICLQVLLSAAIRITLVLLLFGLIDYAIQRYRLSKQLRMTRRELREELRQTEGDPALRSRRRQLAQAWRTRPSWHGGGGSASHRQSIAGRRAALSPS